jgi:hypothetical protein
MNGGRIINIFSTDDPGADQRQEDAEQHDPSLELGVESELDYWEEEFQNKDAEPPPK